ncbi:hypothetical protein [Nocardioides sp.]|uniref:hypothetical protein n=1 Tax=Nocardioides sp. TaxID=35761 RepID=UPI002392B708|nr:hypothetical protein [Nocardioides sp.]MDE0777800.1 hypothetical protein [Nocardioides sp.]
MIWLGLLLVGIGTCDLAFSWTRRPRLAEAVAAGTVALLGLLSGVAGLGVLAVLGLFLVAGAVVLWGESVTYGFGSQRFAVPLIVLGGVLVLALLASVGGDPEGGLLREVLRESTLPLLSDLAPERALLLAGALLVQLSTGNVIVRLVLGASGTTHPLRSATGPSPSLKGGRLLGPMERLLIVGLGLAGEVTAASIVIAAKGLLRFPELQSAKADGTTGPGIHEVTEYFLVGSFVSWTVSLVALALVAVPG